jgi:hypothetical protein
MNEELEKGIEKITDVEWHESKNTPFGTVHYKNRPPNGHPLIRQFFVVEDYSNGDRHVLDSYYFTPL